MLKKIVKTYKVHSLFRVDLLLRKYLFQKSCKASFTSVGRSIELKNKIRELRKARKVTQQELDDALGVTRQTIISLENGKYNASLILAHKAAQFLV